MKSIITKLVMSSALIASITSCSEFLEKEPLSEGTEAIVFKNATQFQQAADAFIEHLPSWKSITWDKNTDIGGLSSNGGSAAPESNNTWKNSYEHIRQYNILLKKAEEYTGDKTAINASVGTAYFFRGMAYFDLLKTFGGVPIVDHVMDVNDEVLYGPRNSRYEVFNFLANDFRKAIELLPKESSIAAADKGRISKEAAQAFFGRVLLYEATWEKYVPSINYDLDGNGTENGAGKTKPEGYPSTDNMFSECKQVSKAVMDEAQANGTYSLWNECDSLSYYYLFNIEEHALADVVDVEVLEGNALYQDVVAIVDADATLIVYLVFGVLQDVDVIVEHVGDVFVLWSLAVQAYHDRMSHVCPHHEILDGDVLATAMIVLAGAVDGGAIIAGAGKEMFLVDVVAGEDVETVAPAIPAHHLGILHGHGIATADRQLGGERAVDIHVLAVSHHDTLVMARHYDAVTENLYIPRAIGG
jgi:hypothetical protein